MKTDKKIRVRLEKEVAAQNRPSPDALWLDPDITGEELISLDPLDPAEIEAMIEQEEGNDDRDGS